MKFNLLNWFRSKLHIDYKQPTHEEVEKFLTENFAVPTFEKNEVIRYFRINQLHEIIDTHFKISTEKEINKAVWRKLNYLIVVRNQYHHSHKYKAIPLIIIGSIVIVKK